MKNEKVRAAFNALLELLPDFQAKRRASQWKRLVLTLCEIYPAEREAILLELRRIVNPGEVPTEKRVKEKRPKKKRATGVAANDAECENCPQRVEGVPDLSAETVRERKEGRRERLLGGSLLQLQKPAFFESVEEVKERFESNAVAMLNFCRNHSIQAGSAERVDTLARIIFENYKP